jgi:hypothetical protein
MAQYYRLDVTLDAKSFAVGALSNYQLDVTLDAESLAVGVLSTKRVEVSLPQVGPQGPQGETGATGPANELTIGSVTTGAPGTQADATLTGEAPNQTLNLAIPRGDQGEVGPPGQTGNQGPAGPANTLAIGTVTTGAAGSSADATLTGDSPAQTLNLVIPRGDKGDTGDQGPAGTATTDAADLTSGTLADARLSSNVPLLDAANTFSANQTLDGTNNVMPNQTTAASGASIMTRDLVESSYTLYPNMIQLQSMSGASAGTFAGVTQNFLVAGDARLRAGGSNGGYASCWFAKNITGQASARIDFSRRVELSGLIQIITADNVDGLVRLSIGASSSSAIPPLADVNLFDSRGIGFEIDSNSGSSAKRIRLAYHDGTTYKQSGWHTFATNASLQNIAISYRLVSNGSGAVSLQIATASGFTASLGGVGLSGVAASLSVTDGPTSTTDLNNVAILASSVQQTSAYTNHATAVFWPMKFRIN